MMDRARMTGLYHILACLIGSGIILMLVML